MQKGKGKVGDQVGTDCESLNGAVGKRAEREARKNGLRKTEALAERFRRERKMQRFFCIGNLTRDPEMAKTPNGHAVCKFGIAVGREYDREAVDFFNVVAWRGLGENVAKYCSKGSKVAVLGQLQNRSYKNKDGQAVTLTEVVAERVEFLNSRNLPAAETSCSGDQVELIDGSDLPF